MSLLFSDLIKAMKAPASKEPTEARLNELMAQLFSSATDKDEGEEDTEPKSQPRSGWAKDSVEVEAYVRGFARRRPEATVTTFRFVVEQEFARPQRLRMSRLESQPSEQHHRVRGRDPFVAVQLRCPLTLRVLQAHQSEPDNPPARAVCRSWP